MIAAKEGSWSGHATPLEAWGSSELHSFWQFAKEELKDFPGRTIGSFRITLSVVLSTIISETLRVPDIVFSLYVIIMVSNQGGLRSLKTLLLLLVGITFGLMVTMAVNICFLDSPWFRLPISSFVLFTGIWLSRVLSLGPLGLLLSVIITMYLAIVDEVSDAESLTRGLLWLWPAAALPVTVAAFTSLLLPASASPAPSPKPNAGLFIQDFRNPDYLRFAAKVTTALLGCLIFMDAVSWPGIRTSLITCIVTGLSTVQARRQVQALRLFGVCAGGLVGLAAVIIIVPRLETIGGLALLLAVLCYPCAWIRMGGPRSSYAGMQMALALFVVLLSGFEPSIDLTGIRDRFMGVLVGITSVWIVFEYIWPDVT